MDFSELKEAARLLEKIRPDLAVTQKNITQSAEYIKPKSQKRAAAEVAKNENGGRFSTRSLTDDPQYKDLKFKDQKLEHLLKNMCLRGNFSHALLADGDGLTIAEFGESYDHNLITALGSILANTLEKGKKLFDADDNVNIIMELNLLDLTVLKSFNSNDTSYYLLIVAPQDVDVKNEVELTMPSLIKLLGN